MSPESFLELHDILKDDLEQYFHPLDASRGAPSGIISPALCLCAAIRYFAGGSSYDIMLMLGMSHSSVFESIWGVVDCVNRCNALAFSFPSPEEQRDIAAGFWDRSLAGFDVVVGAVDAMLVWTKKPAREECRAMECGETQFFCDRKKKFGLNLQAIVDHLGRFTWISLEFPGASLDYLAWSCSDIVSFLEQDGVLLPNHTLVGDNAYVKKKYMAMPILGALPGLEDAYNFYHSQVRIIVECAFSNLVCLCIVGAFCVDRSTAQFSKLDPWLCVFAGGIITVSTSVRKCPLVLMSVTRFVSGEELHDAARRTMIRSAWIVADGLGLFFRGGTIGKMLERGLRLPRRKHARWITWLI